MAKRYTLQDRYRAAAALVASRNVDAASRVVGIPGSTIRDWAREEAFQKLCQEIRSEYGEEIKGQLAQILMAANEVIIRCFPPPKKEG